MFEHIYVAKTCFGIVFMNGLYAIPSYIKSIVIFDITLLSRYIFGWVPCKGDLGHTGAYISTEAGKTGQCSHHNRARAVASTVLQTSECSCRRELWGTLRAI